MDIGQETGRRISEARLAKGWSFDELSKRSGIATNTLRDFEITASLARVKDLAAIADALESTPGSLIPLGHPLEAEWNATAWDVLSATAKGFRAKVCVIGKMAEWKLNELIGCLVEADPNLASAEWNDSDDEPDFRLVWRGKPVTVECKNVRRYADKPAVLRVELQKTRNSKDGSNTRSYPCNKFDVLAACLYNQRHEWRFAFCPTRMLARRKGADALLAIYHDIPDPLVPPWTSKLTEALDRIER